MKQRQWVRITVVFFVLMFALTIFSRAAASVTKAKVTVTNASSQTITHDIQLNGTVEARDHFLQYVPSGLMISSVRVSPGQIVASGDILFVIDIQKLQEEITALESEIANINQKDNLSISRAEKDYQDVKAAAEEQIALTYRDYTDAVNAYNEYVNIQERTVLGENGENDGSEYTDSHAMELEESAKAAWNAYETVSREQNALVESAAVALQQTKEDIALEQNTKELEDRLEDLKSYSQNGGQFLAEHSGTVDGIFVEPGVETTDGAAVLISDSTDGVRLVAVLPEEYRTAITESSTITLTGTGLTGEQTSYTVTDIAISNDDVSESGEGSGYSLSAIIPGDLYMVGSNISVNIGNKSEKYNTCIPLTALRQNGNYQYFIYIADEQDTVLGKEMTAREMPVTVLDKNEKYAAVEEMISGDVIVSSSKDIAEGNRVMVIEE